MRPFSCKRVSFWRRAWPVAAAIIAAGSSARGQRVPVNLPPNAFFVDPAVAGALPAIELAPPQIQSISGATAARLDQVQSLVANQSWDDAIDTLRELSGAESDRVVAIDGNGYVSLRTYCHMQLARLPADGLAQYRRPVDPLAEKWYRQGVAERNEQQLKRILDEAYASSWGDKALLALGELALERGDYAAARSWWEQISPLLRDPTGRPAWQALVSVDLQSQWLTFWQRWHERETPADWLAYPDTNLDLAGVRARLVLVSIRAGELDRAAVELELLQRAHGQAIGRMAGHEGPLVLALERILSAARGWPTPHTEDDWPTFAGGPARGRVGLTVGPVAGPAWDKSVQLPTVVFSANSFSMRGTGGRTMPPAMSPPTPLVHFPIAAGGRVYFANSSTILSVSLKAGEPAISADGVLYRDAAAARRPVTYADGWLTHAPRLSVTLCDDLLLARMGPTATYRALVENGPTGELVGLELSRDGALAFRARPEDKAWSFDGVPVAHDGRIYVAMRRSDVNPVAAVACFDMTTSRQLWRTQIGSANTPAAGRGDEVTHNLLTLAGERVYLNTNLGLVAALRADDGAICWLRRYERHSGRLNTVDGKFSPHFARDPSPAVYYAGMLIIAASDADPVFALDAETGEAVWSSDELSAVIHLLAVAEGNLVASGEKRLWLVDPLTGRVRKAIDVTDGQRCVGRGVVAGREVFWPVNQEIQVFDAATGEPSRAPIHLSAVGEHGANLIAAEGYLIAAGHDRMMAYGAPKSQSPNP